MHERAKCAKSAEPRRDCILGEVSNHRAKERPMPAYVSSKTFSNKQPRNDLTAEYVRSVLNYNSATGAIWHKPRPIRPENIRHDKIWNARYTAEVARKCKPGSYLAVRLNGASYRAHRLAWLMYYGEWPDSLIDHINGITHDNRIANLRAAKHSENIMNSCMRADNSSGFKGVDYMSSKAAWRARIGINGRNIFLGTYPSPEEAYVAYCAAAVNIHGEFRRVE